MVLIYVKAQTASHASHWFVVVSHILLKTTNEPEKNDTCLVFSIADAPVFVSLQLRLDGCPLSSSELSVSFTISSISDQPGKLNIRYVSNFYGSVFQVLPKPGQLIIHVQTSPPVAMAPERSNQEVSSGAGELSDSMSVGDACVSHVRKKKSRVTDGAFSDLH